MNDIYYIKLEYKYNTNKNSITWLKSMIGQSIIEGY